MTVAGDRPTGETRWNGHRTPPTPEAHERETFQTQPAQATPKSGNTYLMGIPPTLVHILAVHHFHPPPATRMLPRPTAYLKVPRQDETHDPEYEDQGYALDTAGGEPTRIKLHSRPHALPRTKRRGRRPGRARLALRRDLGPAPLRRSAAQSPGMATDSAFPQWRAHTRGGRRGRPGDGGRQPRRGTASVHRTHSRGGRPPVSSNLAETEQDQVAGPTTVTISWQAVCTADSAGSVSAVASRALRRGVATAGTRSTAASGASWWTPPGCCRPGGARRHRS